MKLLKLSLLSIGLFAALASCDSKSEDPQPSAPTEAPVVANAEMSRQLYYPADGHSGGVIYPLLDIKRTGHLTAEQLELSFAAEPGQDAVTFKVPAAKLSANLIGSYALQSLPAPATGSVDVWYVLTTDQRTGGLSGAMYGSRTNLMDGQVVVTAYDARRHLISGTYSVRLAGISDPYTNPTGSSSGARCNLTLAGSFENLVLQ